MDIAIATEVQTGLTWPRWQRLAAAAEQLGFAALYCTDHLATPAPPSLDSLDCWMALAWLASRTQRLEFGPLVSPVSFRHPVHLLRMGRALDDLSGGRFHLGVGAGWQQREHELFGFELLGVKERMDRFAEALEVIRLLRSGEPADFAGRYYGLKAASVLPRPERPNRPRLLIGAKYKARGLPLAARYADEWNAAFIPAGEFRQLNAELDRLLVSAGRQPGDVRRSLATGLVFGRTDQELRQKLAGADERRLREHVGLIGTPAAIADSLGRYVEAGVQRLILQWLDLDDLDGLEALARAVV